MPVRRALLLAVGLLQVLRLLVLREGEDRLEHAAVEHVLEELVREGALGAEGRRLSVMYSLVCESKAGFSMRQLTKTLHLREE